MKQLKTNINQDIRSFNVPFATNRTINKGKINTIKYLLYAQKYITNTIYSDMFNGTSLWKDMIKDDSIFIRQHYQQEFKSLGIKSAYIQNIVSNAISEYFDTLKSLKALNRKGIKARMNNSPKIYTFKQYNLDDRHFSLKGARIQRNENTGIYYFQISNPLNKIRGSVIRIPLTGYKYIQEKLDSIVKGSFNGKVTYSLAENGIKIITATPLANNVKVTKGLFKAKQLAKLDKGTLSDTNLVLGLDFGKRIALSNKTMFKLNKFYNKAKLIKLKLAEYDQTIQNMKKKRNYGVVYDEIKQARKALYTKTNGMRKATYHHVTNKISNILKSIEEKEGVKPTLAIEDLSFKTIEKDDSKYRGKSYNKMLSVMAVAEWMKIVLSVMKREGFPVMLIDAHHTSQTCGVCYYVDAKNRKGENLKCLKCGNCDHSDLNASVVVKMLCIAWPYFNGKTNLYS